jgi:hypothetical protein
MPIGGVPWWVWLLVPLVRSLAGVAVALVSMIGRRRSIDPGPGARRWTVRIIIERRR